MNKEMLKDENILLENEKESKKYLEEIEKLETMKCKLLGKKREADTNIKKLQVELAQLDRKQLFETDPIKIKEMKEKKKEIRYEIEEYESVKSMKYNPIIKDMLKEIDPFISNAEKEKDKFDRLIYQKEKQYEAEREAYNKEMQEKIDNLNSLNLKHSYNIATGKMLSIKMDKEDW